MNYEQIYNAIVAKAKSEDRKKIKGGIYYEAHHIIPRCMGGDGNAYDILHTNIILLTAKEHYMAHKLLCEIYPDNNKLRYALWCMVSAGRLGNKRYIPSGRIYTQLREAYSLSIKGKIITEEQKKKISAANKGKVHSEEFKKNLSNINKGKYHSEETKKKISDANKGKLPWTAGIKRGPMSIEQKKKLSDINKGKIRGPMSDEQKKKISDSWKKKVRK